VNKLHIWRLVLIKPLTATNLFRNSTAVKECQRQLHYPPLIPVLEQIYLVYAFIAYFSKEMFLYHSHLQHEVSLAPYFNSFLQLKFLWASDPFNVLCLPFSSLHDTINLNIF
jgi:hypothetical protein